MGGFVAQIVPINSPVRTFFGAIIVSSLCHVDLLALPTAADKSKGSPVELHCKIVAPTQERSHKLWRVELRKSTGEPARRSVASNGDTVRFKKLEPGIYSVCISGENNRSHCQSVDLVPPSGEIHYRFEKTIETPPAAVNQSDKHQVNASRLAIPDKAKRQLQLSEEAHHRGDRQQAIRHLETALEIYPKYADALNNLGTYYHRSGNYTRSIEYFRKATSIDPNLFAGWVNLAGSLLATGKFDKALEANRKAIGLRPGDALANSQMGINLYYQRQFAEARRYFQRVAVLDPYSANSPHLYLAHIALAEKSPREAEGFIRKHLELHPNSPQGSSLRQTLRNLATLSVARTSHSDPQR